MPCRILSTRRALTEPLGQGTRMTDLPSSVLSASGREIRCRRDAENTICGVTVGSGPRHESAPPSRREDRPRSARLPGRILPAMAYMQAGEHSQDRIDPMSDARTSGGRPLPVLDERLAHRPLGRRADGGGDRARSFDRPGPDRWCCAGSPGTRARRRRTTAAGIPILDAIKTPATDRPPIWPHDPILRLPFYVMQRVDRCRSARLPAAWGRRTAPHGQASSSTSRPRRDPRRRLAGLRLPTGHTEAYLQRQIGRWLRQLDAYDGRELPAARTAATG